MYMPLFQFILGQLEKQYNIRASLLSLEYSLSPEHKWPIACHEAVQSYRYLVHELGISPSRIVLMGDSAGGNLALTTLINLRDLRVKRKEKTQNTPPLPLPAGIGLISPWVDLTTDIYPSRPDCVSPRLLNMYISNYAPHQNLTHSLISPVHATLEGLSSCHWLVTYGEHEIIRESIQTLVSRIEQHNYSLKTLVCTSEAHVSMTHPLMSTTPEAFRRDGGTLIQWLADISA
ncbi:Alpha/Beta hydrolase protein [Gilbertella persicaria]|uniref:Alpha/Beta hydrolase protein n=1 Tax=Gilbertella persicaria TaxID=101096 RepID=UPI0022207CB6|nr:Alpha/Beta hydrolase protein [Gilbertella persicaria]KAI8048319.1 Alpha/Beta hydrolase protein [Gilbertella persicaria]